MRVPAIACCPTVTTASPPDSIEKRGFSRISCTLTVVAVVGVGFIAGWSGNGRFFGQNIPVRRYGVQVQFRVLQTTDLP